MTHIPRAVCLTCNREMTTDKSGVIAEGVIESGPYYKIAADRLVCELCHGKILCGWASRPSAHHFEDNYADRLKPDHVFVFNGERYQDDALADGILAIRSAIEDTEMRLEILRSKLARAEKLRETTTAGDPS